MPISEYLAELRSLIGHRALMVPSASVVVRRGDAVLCGRHRVGGKWLVPGGAIDPGETPAQAAVREVREETGLNVRIVKLVGVWGGTPDHHIVYPNGDVVDYTMTTFEAEVISGELMADPEEFLEVAWVPVSELKTLELEGWMHDVVEALEGPSIGFRRP